MTTGASVARVLTMTSSAKSEEPPQTVVLILSYNTDVYGWMWSPQHMYDSTLLLPVPAHLLYICYIS